MKYHFLFLLCEQNSLNLKQQKIRELSSSKSLDTTHIFLIYAFMHCGFWLRIAPNTSLVTEAQIHRCFIHMYIYM